MRRWQDINPGTEFRCWIREGEVLCLSQRDISNFYPHMSREEESIKQDIITFFSEHIRGKFPLSDFILDVVRPRKDKVILVDLNPWGETTDTLLFTWNQLSHFPLQSPVQFRYVQESG